MVGMFGDHLPHGPQFTLFLKFKSQAHVNDKVISQCIYETESSWSFLPLIQVLFYSIPSKMDSYQNIQHCNLGDFREEGHMPGYQIKSRYFGLINSSLFGVSIMDVLRHSGLIASSCVPCSPHKNSSF